MDNPQITALIDGINRLDPMMRRLFLWKYYLSLAPAHRKPHWPPETNDPVKIRKYMEWELEASFNSQSIGFMAEMLPHMYPHLDTVWKGDAITVLDIGARTGAGSALLSVLFMEYFSKFRMEVDTIDLSPEFRDYQITRWPTLRNVRIGNIFDLAAGSYDVIICSHTLEHLDDPIPFARQCAKIAKRFAFFYCPYNEVDPVPDHRIVGDTVIDALNPLDKKIIPSWFFRKGEDYGMTPCVFFTLPGINYTPPKSP